VDRVLASLRPWSLYGVLSVRIELVKTSAYRSAVGCAP